MAEKCISTIDDTSLNYINDIEFHKKNKTANHIITYDDNTPLISLNNSTTDLNNLLTTTTAITNISPKNVITSVEKEVLLIVSDDNNDDKNVKEDTKKKSEKVNIYIETPVIDELNIISTKKIVVQPKRLSDEFFSADDCDDDNDNDDDDINKLNKTEILEHKREGVLVLKTEKSRLSRLNIGLSDGVGCSSKSNSTITNSRIDSALTNNDKKNQSICCHPSISDNHLNIVCDNNNINNDNIIIEDEEIIYDENDVQSMDAIERRDYEQEQILTGGVIVRNCSLINNSENRLNVGLIKNNLNNEDSTIVRFDEDKKSSQQHTLTTTPTSSRCSTIRTTTSTITATTIIAIQTPTTKSPNKLNLTTSLDRNDESEFNKLDKHKINSNFSGESSKNKLQPQESSKELEQEPGDFVVEYTNSNDSLLSINYQEEIVKNDCKNDVVASSSTKYNIQNTGECDINQQIPSCSTSLSSSKEGSKIFVTASSSISTSSSPNCQFAEFPTGNCCKDNRETVNVGDSNDIVENDEVDEEEVNGINRTKPIIRPSRFQNVDVMLELSRGKSINFDGNDFAASSSRRLTRNIVNRNLEDQVLEPSQMAMIVENENEFDEDTWADCEEGSDIEEICTCKNYTDEEERNGSSEDELPSRDVDLSGYTNIDTLPDDILHDPNNVGTPRIHRKRKLTINLGSETPGGRKRLALQLGMSRLLTTTPTSTELLGSPLFCLSERRTPRCLIPTKENPPPELCDWLIQFQKWSHAERILAVDRLIERCEPTQVRHMMKVIEPQFQRDFISLLPKEVALQVLTYLEPNDLLRAAQTCRNWRFLCDDNLLWKEKCKQVGIVIESSTDKPKRGRAGNMPRISSPWKAAYMRQNIIEMNWRSRPIREPKILKGHDDHVITCLQFCGNRIVSGSDDNTLKVWSAVSGKCLRTLVGHTGGVWSSQMSGNIIISGSTDRTLKVWNAESGQCVHTLFGHTSTVRCMHLHENKVVSGSRDATLRVWDINSGVCLHVLVGHLAAVRCVQYDGRLVVSGAYDYMVKVWNPERQECLHTLQGHTNRVYSLQFDGVHVVSGSLDTSIRVWDAETGSCKHTLMGHQSLTSGMELRQNILVSGNADSTVKVWDIITGQCLQTLSGSNKHQSAVTCLQFNSRFVITSSDDGTVKLWDVKTGEFIRNLVALDSGGSGGVVWRIRANDTKLVCAVGSRNGTEETKLMVLDFDVEGACLKCS